MLEGAGVGRGGWGGKPSKGVHEVRGLMLMARENQERTENGLANLWSTKKLTKKAHAGHGPETKWEMSN
jgi:hypothetical protein